MKIYLVGGAVRDWLLGRVPIEFDFAFDADTESFLQANPGACKVGRSVNVIIFNGCEYMPLRGGQPGALAGARPEGTPANPNTSSASGSATGSTPGSITNPATDSVSGSAINPTTNPVSNPTPDPVTGSTLGLAADASADLLAADLACRDLTINALAVEENGVLHCHPLALADLQDRVLRPASGTSFFDDPLRVFRLARMACLLPHFLPHPSALDQMRHVERAGLLATIPAERVGAETIKALSCPKPSAWLKVLHAGNCLALWYAELACAADIPAGPEPWHNESVLQHLGEVMDAVAGNPLRVWMALCHDLGKMLTPPENWPHHYGHESLGEMPARTLAERLALPNIYRNAGALASLLHMRAGRYLRCRPGVRRDLLVQIHAAHLWEPFWTVVEADAGHTLRPAADADLADLLSVTLPPEWRDKGEESGRHLREMQCQALKRRLKLEEA